MVKFTKKELLAGEVSVSTIDLTDIKSFCLANNLEDYEVNADKTKEELLNEIVDLIEAPEPVSAPVIEDIIKAVTPISAKQYAEANGKTVAEVCEITGLKQWNSKLKPEHIEMMENAPATETVSVEPIPEPEPVIAPNRLARQKARKAERLAQTGGNLGAYIQQTIATCGSLEKAPARIRRYIEKRQKAEGGK